jgi:hypothetical protein
MSLAWCAARPANTLAVWCLGRGCNHHRVIDVDRFGKDLSAPSFGPKMRCTRCNRLGADVRPNWNEQYAHGAFTGRRWGSTLRRVTRMQFEPFRASPRDHAVAKSQRLLELLKPTFLLIPVEAKDHQATSFLDH